MSGNNPFEKFGEGKTAATGGEVIPFGKHKGRSLAEVRMVDPDYVTWLTQQDWFADRFKPIYNFFMNVSPPSEATPEHNAMQVKFLDVEIRKYVASQMGLTGEVAKDVLFEEGADVRFYVENKTVIIELKPSLGDDFPAVLRQMKNQVMRDVQSFMWPQHRQEVQTWTLRRLVQRAAEREHYHALCYSQFAARGASLDQVRQIFQEAGIWLVELH